MNNELSPYEYQFTTEERKKIIAQTLEEIRKSKGYSQKQVAAFIKVKPTTYNTYESGRTPVDTLVQRDRLHRGALDIQKQLEEYQKQARLMEEQLTANNGDNPAAQAILEAMKQVIEGMKSMNQNPEIRQQLESTLDE